MPYKQGEFAPAPAGDPEPRGEQRHGGKRVDEPDVELRRQPAESRVLAPPPAAADAAQAHVAPEPPETHQLPRHQLRDVAPLLAQVIAPELPRRAVARHLTLPRQLVVVRERFQGRHPAAPRRSLRHPGVVALVEGDPAVRGQHPPAHDGCVARVPGQQHHGEHGRHRQRAPRAHPPRHRCEEERSRESPLEHGQPGGTGERGGAEERGRCHRLARGGQEPLRVRHQPQRAEHQHQVEVLGEQVSADEREKRIERGEPGRRQRGAGTEEAPRDGGGQRHHRHAEDHLQNASGNRVRPVRGVESGEKRGIHGRAARGGKPILPGEPLPRRHPGGDGVVVGLVTPGRGGEADHPRAEHDAQHRRRDEDRDERAPRGRAPLVRHLVFSLTDLACVNSSR